jgi:hypothetical protein
LKKTGERQHRWLGEKEAIERYRPDATERRETMKNERNTKEKEGIQDIK